MSNIPEENMHGDCYPTAFRYFMENNFKADGSLRLVHGLVTGQGAIAGIIYNHAWVEDVDENVVYDMTMPEAFQILPTPVYYQLGKVQKTYKYDYQEVV
jgi:hypothetical protein